MRARSIVASLAVGALALGLLAPVAANAAPTVDKPSGKALVRVDGGTAVVKKLGKGEYRIIAPKGAKVSWFGEVSGKGMRVGSFTPGALVGAWAAMGHRDGAKATTALTWVAPGDKRPTVVPAGLSKPRVNKSGELTFVATLDGRLPTSMKDFSINVQRAGKSMRDTTGVCIGLTSNLCILAKIIAESEGQIVYQEGVGSTAPSPCQGPFGIGPGLINVSPFSCDGYTVGAPLADGGPSNVWWNNQTGEVSANMSIKDAVGAVFIFALVLLWQAIYE